MLFAIGSVNIQWKDTSEHSRLEVSSNRAEGSNFVRNTKYIDMAARPTYQFQVRKGHLDPQVARTDTNALG